MDFLEYLGEQKWVPTSSGKNNLDKVLNKYFLKKNVSLDRLSEDATMETKKYYSLLSEITHDGRYMNKNLEMYIRTFNITSEIPDFMKPWIKKEYRRYLALKKTTETLQIGINCRYSRDIRNIILKYDSEKESIFMPFTLRVGIDKLFVDEEFFDNMEYVLLHSGFEPFVKSQIHNKLSEWRESFHKIFQQKYNEVIIE